MKVLSNTTECKHPCLLLRVNAWREGGHLGQENHRTEGQGWLTELQESEQVHAFILRLLQQISTKQSHELWHPARF